MNLEMAVERLKAMRWQNFSVSSLAENATDAEAIDIVLIQLQKLDIENAQLIVQYAEIESILKEYHNVITDIQPCEMCREYRPNSACAKEKECREFCPCNTVKQHWDSPIAWLAELLLEEKISGMDENELEPEKYRCEYCGLEMEWDKTYFGHGDIWICEKCDKPFCSECARKILGAEKYETIIDLDKTLCPECAKTIEEVTHAE